MIQMTQPQRILKSLSGWLHRSYTGKVHNMFDDKTKRKLIVSRLTALGYVVGTGDTLNKQYTNEQLKHLHRVRYPNLRSRSEWITWHRTNRIQAQGLATETECRAVKTGDADKCVKMAAAYIYNFNATKGLPPTRIVFGGNRIPDGVTVSLRYKPDKMMTLSRTGYDIVKIPFDTPLGKALVAIVTMQQLGVRPTAREFDEIVRQFAPAPPLFAEQ